MFINKKKKISDLKFAVKVKNSIFFYIFRVLFIILVIIGIYIVINFVNIFNRNGIKIYEVTNGEIVNVDRHRGFIYRDEAIERCNNDGYINYYVSNAERVNRGAFIYSINDSRHEIIHYDLNDNDKKHINQSIKMYINNITDNDFINTYVMKDNINNIIDEINIVKQLEYIDIEKEIDAKEKGYSRYAGLISFIIDGYENYDVNDFNDDLIKNYSNKKVINQLTEVNSGDEIYKIIKSPEYSLVFDSSFDYDNYNRSNNVLVKFVYENLTTNGTIESFIGNDGQKHFKINITEYPERFIDKRIVEFEIENRKISGYKIPIKSITSKNCYIIPKNMVEKDFETDENVFYKIGLNGERIRLTCNISKEDDNYYYISLDDTLSKLKYGDVLINRYNDNYSLSEVVKLEGVYNMNKGYAIFKNVDVIDRTNEYAIIKKQSIAGVSLYDHIALDANDVKEGDLIS